MLIQTDRKARKGEPGFIVAFALCLMFCWSSGIHAQIIQFDISPQSLEDALLEFSRQSNKAVLIKPDEIQGLRSPSVVGYMTADAALALMLKDTTLKYRGAAGDGYIIVAKTFKDVSFEEDDVKRAGADRLEEIMVTAEKRSASIQDVALAVSAFDEYAIDKNHVKTVGDFVGLVPSLQTSSHGDTNALDISMRGIASTNRTELGDPAVAFHIDGIYSPRPQGAGILIYDVERVEVLRGPQGTIFGRNASIGSVNIETAKPKLGVFEGKTSYILGNYDRLGVKGALNIPVADNYAIRFAAYSNRHDAYVDTIPNYLDYYNELDANNLSVFEISPEVAIRGYEAAEQTSWRISNLLAVTENIDWFFSYEFYKDSGTGAIDLDPFIVNNTGDRVAVVDSPGMVDMSIGAFRSRLDINTDNIAFSYLLGVGQQERQQIWDADLGRTGNFEEHRTEHSRYDSVSHELHLKNNSDSRFQWLIGLYASEEDNAIRFDIEQTDSGGAISFRQPQRRLSSNSAFVQGTLSMTDDFRITLGARRIIDRKSDDRGRNIGCGSFIRRPEFLQNLGGVVPPNQDLFNAFEYGVPGTAGGNAIVVDRTNPMTGNTARIAVGVVNPATDTVIAAADPDGCWLLDVNDVDAEWDDTIGLARAEYDFSDDIMLYWGVGTGFKSGIIQDAGNEADPETVENVEIGFKSMLLDGKLQLNLAVFDIDYKNLQVSREIMLDQDNDGVNDFQGRLLTQNATRASIAGLELELDWLFGNGGRFGAIVSLIDATYDEFDTIDPYWGQNNPWNPPASDPELAASGFVSLAGNELVRAPNYTMTLHYEHILFTGPGSWIPRIKIQFSDDMFLDEHNRTSIIENGVTYSNLSRQPAYQLVDVSLRYEPMDSNWSLEFFIDNATDKNVRTGLGDYIGPEGFSSYYLPPKTFGIIFEQQFD